MLIIVYQILQQNNNSAMKGEEMRTPLLKNTAAMQINKEVEEEESAFIVRYNQVIKAYNKYAQEGLPKMQIIVGNAFITKISEYLGKPLYIVAFALVIVLVPIVNIICLSCIFTYLFYLKRQNKKHLRNISRVQDPFQNFFFMPEMCEQIGKHHATINLQPNQIQGFTFNEQLRGKLSSKLRENKGLNSNQTLTVLIYDQYFYDSFYLYRKEFYKTLVWALMGILLVTISILVYLSLLFPE